MKEILQCYECKKWVNYRFAGKCAKCIKNELKKEVKE